MNRTAAIPALTGIRAVAALWVVLQHFGGAILLLLPALEPVRPAVMAGWLGVEVFFVLSGFVIAYNYAEKLQSARMSDLRAFWAARVARIYPVHLATLAVMGALVLTASMAGVALTSDARNTPANFVGSLFVLQALPPFRGINWPSWSVCCEFVAYLLFPLLAIGLARLSGRGALRWAAATAVGGALGMVAYAWVSGSWWSMDYPVMWWRIAVGFTLGALFWKWWSSERPGGLRWDVVAGVCVVATLVTVYVTGKESPATYLALPALALFVLAVASSTGIVARLLSTRVAQWFGHISYSLYMTHFVVFLVSKKLIGWDRFAGTPLLERLAVLGATAVLVVGTAAATYYLVEEPGRKFLRRRLRPRATAPVG